MRWLLLTIPLFLIGCSGPKQIGATDFMRTVQSPYTSLKADQYIGQSSTRAYAEHWNKHKLRSDSVQIYWTPLNEFTPQQRETLIQIGHRNENNPPAK